MPAWGIDPPECMLHAFSRDNHLGNTAQLNAGEYDGLEEGAFDYGGLGSGEHQPEAQG